jgi:hypothetical protein
MVDPSLRLGFEATFFLLSFLGLLVETEDFRFSLSAQLGLLTLQTLLHFPSFAFQADDFLGGLLAELLEFLVLALELLQMLSLHASQLAALFDDERFPILLVWGHNMTRRRSSFEQPIARLES